MAISSLICLLFTTLIATLSRESNSWSVERIGGWVTVAEEYEEWDEWVTQTCTREVPDGVDKDGKPQTKTEEYDCSYRDYHHPYWQVITSNGDTIQITQSEFFNLVYKFGNETKVDMHRDYYTIDGDKNVTKWAENKPLQPVFTEHTYRNKVQASQSLFSHIIVSNRSHLYDYPKLRFNFSDPAILGSDINLKQADESLQLYNARMGKIKQVKVWILLFKNQPRSTGLEQESYWKGGQKNEVVVCIGSNADKKWCHTFCWSPDGNTSNDMMKIEIRDHIENNNLSLMETVDFVTKKVTEKFVRKQFKEFEYLTVETPIWASITVLMVSMIISMVTIIFHLKDNTIA